MTNHGRYEKQNGVCLCLVCRINLIFSATTSLSQRKKWKWLPSIILKPERLHLASLSEFIRAALTTKWHRHPVSSLITMSWWHKNDWFITGSFLIWNFPTLQRLCALLNHVEFVEPYFHWLLAGKSSSLEDIFADILNTYLLQNSICLSGTMTWKALSITAHHAAPMAASCLVKCWYLFSPLGCKGCFVSSLKSSPQTGCKSSGGSGHILQPEIWAQETLTCTNCFLSQRCNSHYLTFTHWAQARHSDATVTPHGAVHMRTRLAWGKTFHWINNKMRSIWKIIIKA